MCNFFITRMIDQFGVIEEQFQNPGKLSFERDFIQLICIERLKRSV